MTGARRAAATALLVMGCLALVATSTPRRVGDGVEYWAMAEQMASFRLPSATRADILRLERDARRIGHGYETSPLRFDHLVAADGRQDFPHFWLYPLVNVPALWLTRLAGVHPNWAFTLTNGALLAVAFVIVSRAVSMAWAALLLAGPVIWWSDKSHGDIFTLSLLAAGCARWRRAPAWTLVLVALAAAQNPALMPVWVVVATVALWRAGWRKAVVGIAMGAAIVAVPLVYYKWRLDVWSPLAGYTKPTWPSVRMMMSFIADANVGLLVNLPFVCLAMVWGVAHAWRRRGLAPIVWRDWLLMAAAWALLLAAFAQSVNMNHGATPGINRWTLWLTPWVLLVVPLDASARTLLVLAVLNSVWAVWFFRPSLPEVYRYPTRTASWLWTHAPAWYSPTPEIFAERVSHREPAVLPTAWEGCTKVLAVNGEWPAPCLPPANVPQACFGPDALCYAVDTHVVALGPSPFQFVVGARRWPAGQPYVEALRARVAAGVARDARLAPRPLAESALRATDGVGWASVWMGASTIAIYLDTISPGASLQLRVDADYRGELIDLDQDGRVLGVVDVPRSGENPTPVILPAQASHALLWLEAR